MKVSFWVRFEFKKVAGVLGRGACTPDVLSALSG